jgi:hypothetical protein
MMTKKWIFLIISLLIMTTACNLISNITNPVDEVVTEIENIAEDVNIDEIEEGLETIATELPSEVGDLENLQATAEAMAGEFEMGEAPPDIPILEDEKENYFASKDLVSYQTSTDYDEVLRFYRNEMPDQDWMEKKEGTIVTDTAAVIHFRKKNRDAIVTLSINPLDQKTIVMITIQTR